MTPGQFRGGLAQAVIDWQRQSGRHDLPWQQTRDPYRIWVSEIMLQQTQVSTVLAYFDRFMARFPDVQQLALADLDEVLGLWSGLGYYSRARHLHACARVICEHHDGRFPRDPVQLEALPGIGRSTAAAIAAFAWGVRAAILDGNVKRVLCRVFGIEGHPAQPDTTRQLWAIAERELPEAGPNLIEAYTQGMMDLGATLCTRSNPRCGQCPLKVSCMAHQTQRTAELPSPRPPRSLPTRRAHWLIVRAGSAVLLERRVTRGLWGGLWSLPEVVPPTVDPVAPDAADVAAFVSARLGLAGVPERAGGEVRHVFTHFRLQALLWSVRVAAPGDELPEVPGHEWIRSGQLAQAPLPQPVRALLQTVLP